MSGPVEAALAAILRGANPSKLEGERLDFKLPKPTLKEAAVDLAEAAICFANASGGVIVVGVRDHPGGPDAFVGTNHDVDVIRRRIFELTEPGLTVDVSELHYQGARLLTIRVPTGVEVHATKKGHAHRRLGADCLPMTPNAVARLTEERRGVDWAAFPSGRHPSQVDSRAISDARRLVGEAARSAARGLARGTGEDLLRALGLVCDDGTLSRGGEILLCQHASSAAPEVLVYQHRRTMGGEADAVVRWGPPVLVAIEEAVAAISARQGIRPVTLRNGVQLQIEDYPMVAVREALVNALAHGDYRLRRPVTIEHSPEALTIVSPGPLVTGVTHANILTVGSRARFPSILRALRHLGLVEELGQGVDRMFREMVRSGRDLPVIAEESDQVTLRLTGGPPTARIIQFIRELPEDARDDTDTLLVIWLLCHRRTATAQDVATLVQRPVPAAQLVLHRLATDVRIIEPTRGTVSRRHPAYRLTPQSVAQLGPAVTHVRRSTSETDAKVLAHVREYGYINNGTLQRLFDVDVYAARDMLRDLVGRELLARTSQQSRGTAVRYGPGPRFPGRRPRNR